MQVSGRLYTGPVRPERLLPAGDRCREPDRAVWRRARWGVMVVGDNITRLTLPQTASLAAFAGARPTACR